MAYAIKVEFDKKSFQETCRQHAKNLAFITFEEASAITKEFGRGFAVGSLYNASSAGALRAKKMGHNVYVDWSMLLDFLQKKAR